MKKLTLIVLAVVLAAPAVFAASAISTNVDNVTASVAAVCKVNAFNLAFGPYDGVVTNAVTALDTQANVDVFCTKGTAPTSISMGVGSFGGAGVGRNMTNGTDNLSYEVYLNSTRTTIWNTVNTITPNASVSKNTALTTGGVANTTIIAYGRIPAGQDVSTGAYTGTIQATVNF
jgi:spore coat protein U-like protein